MFECDKPILLLIVKTWLGGDRQCEKRMTEIQPSYHLTEGDALTCVINQMKEDNPPVDWMILKSVTGGNQRDPIDFVKIIRRKSN